jgi:molybdopterin-containing oxidoreductase family iron-sulfur binding subunit
MDLSALRARMAETSGKTWWRGLDELADTPEFRQMLHREFPEAASEFDDPVGRRSFLKLMSASLALAGATACTRIPDEKIVPYVRAPEDAVPGRPHFYATAMTFAGAATPVLVESHQGRPTKIEPNPEHPATRGGTDVAAQASVLTLYDPDRAQALRFLGEIRPWSQLLGSLQAELNAQKGRQGAGLRLLTGTVISPTLADQIAQLLTAYPQATWVQWEAAGPDNARAGALQAFGEYVEPQFRFDKAAVILSLDADVLGTGPGRLRYTRDIIDGRRLAGEHAVMNRIYVAESTPSLLGLKADHRVALRAADVEAFARAVAAGLGVAGAGAPALPAGVAPAVVTALVKDLAAHKGAAVVVAGDQQPPAVHALAHPMNDALGAVGQTVVYTPTIEARPANQLADLTQLASDLDAGRVDLLVTIGVNPVYDAPPDLKFAERMQKAKLRVFMGLYEDETAALAQWVVPETHFLEHWSDARAFDGTVSIVQPLIAPLYENHSPHELLAVLNGRVDATPYAVVREFWEKQYASAEGRFGPMVKDDGTGHASFDQMARQALHDGFIAGSAFTPREVTLRPEAVGAAAAVPPADALEVTFRPCPNVHDGSLANNGWLQELPRPVTKLVWDNALLVSPDTARRLGVLDQDLVTLRLHGQQIELPVWRLPGQPDNSLMVTIGYGRARAGRVGTGVGVDVNAVRPSAALWMASGAEVAANGERYQLACTQGHFAIENRHHVRSAVLEHYHEEPDFAAHAVHTFGEEMTLYNPDEWKYEGHAWGMSIDLNACTGCNACVVACQAENNIPVVGKDQVARQREMHWLRIDRYYTGEENDPKETYFQPMMCHHCEAAPCEVVCPVAATVHSSEGLNDMVYNRCVGTRYCSHNCPYKVRRFNFFLYNDWETPSLKMVRNPDVTVRSRGVMEKCTYCVQRINWARIDAKREDRGVRDGEVVTACEAACPARAIVFGNVNDASSRVAAAKKLPRAYGALAELNVRPRTTYLAAVRNPNPEIEPYEKPAGGHGHVPAADQEHGDSVKAAPARQGGELTYPR